MPGLVPGIHVDGRDEPGHDELEEALSGSGNGYSAASADGGSTEI